MPALDPARLTTLTFDCYGTLIDWEAGAIEAHRVTLTGERFGFPVTVPDREALAASVPAWMPFPDTVDALRALARRYRLAIISNIDDDLFA